MTDVSFPQKKPTFTMFLWKMWHNIQKYVVWFGQMHKVRNILFLTAYSECWMSSSVSYKLGNSTAGLAVRDIKWLTVSLFVQNDGCGPL